MHVCFEFCVHVNARLIQVASLLIKIVSYSDRFVCCNSFVFCATLSFPSDVWVEILNVLIVRSLHLLFSTLLSF